MGISAAHGISNSSLPYPMNPAAERLVQTFSSSLYWPNKIILDPIINNFIPRIIERYLPTISEFGGSIAGSIFPYATISLSIGQFAADKLVALENVKQWKSVCAAMTLAAYIGVMCFGPAFIGQSIVYKTLGSILGGIQGLKLVGAEIPKNYVERKIRQYISMATSVFVFLKTHGLPLAQSIRASA